MTPHTTPSRRQLAFAIALCFSLFSSLLPTVNAHIAAWHPGMYCLNGTTRGVDNNNANEAVNPLYKLKRSDWWMHHVNGCDRFPPAPGKFLELPAGKHFTVELTMNRAVTSLSYNGRYASQWGDGKAHVGLGRTSEGKSPDGCIVDPNIHTRNEAAATGTVFAISYHSNLADVTPENLVVFSVLYNTPWKRIAKYQVPTLPACPPGGCHCAWGWVPDDCGEPNMYMLPYRCKVVGQTGRRHIAPAVAPVWCDDDHSKCVKGAKQMIYYNQLEGNNIAARGPRAPTYGKRLGFANGAQHDIFVDQENATPTFIVPGPSNTPSDGSVITSQNVNAAIKENVPPVFQSAAALFIAIISALWQLGFAFI